MDLKKFESIAHLRASLINFLLNVFHCLALHRAIQPPLLRPPRALATASAVITHLPFVEGDGLAGVIRRRGDFDPRPIAQNSEKAGDVVDDLPSVLAAEFTPAAPLPYGNSGFNLIVLGSV